MKKKIALRIDDIGASTKKYEVYSKKLFGNILFLKYLKYFRAWAPYSEMTVEMWEQVMDILKKTNACLTVGVTAAWVNKDNSIVPFPEKFPKEAKILQSGFNEGLVEIANHGLTHCVVGKHLPRMFFSNRKYHREYWDWISRDIHFEHMEKSQKIFFEWLGETVTTLIPPGNVYSLDTLEAAEKYGIKRINSYIDHGVKKDVRIINLDFIDAFHDRELVLDGIGYLQQKIATLSNNTQFVFVKDL